MAYKGDTYQIPCDRGGLNHNVNIDLIPPEAIVHPSRNINAHEGGRRTRGGTSHVYGAALSGAGKITGIFDFRMEDGTQFIMCGTSDGKVFKNDTDTIKTGLTSDTFFSFAVMDDLLYISNGYDIPLTWAGSGDASNMTNIPADWTGDNYPKQFVKHGKGNSERMWAFGFKDGTVYASQNGTGTQFSDTYVTTLPINTGDGYGIVGGFVFGDRLFAVGKAQVYIIDDQDMDVANWGYDEATWKGGAAHHRLIVRTPTDVHMMSEDMEIFSVATAEQYGDYKAASLTRPAKIDIWMQQNINPAYINDFHGVWDSKLRAVKWFVVRNGQTQPDTALVFFIDRPLEEAWFVHDNDSYDSGYACYSSALVRKSTGVYKVYTGGKTGFVWELETSNANDNGNGYTSLFRTANLNFGDPRSHKLFNSLRIVTQPAGEWNLGVNIWLDGESQAGRTIALTTTGGVLDSFILDTDTLGGATLTDAVLKLGMIGKRIQIEIYNAVADQEFFVSQVLIDFKKMGKRND